MRFVVPLVVVVLASSFSGFAVADHDDEEVRGNTQAERTLRVVCMSSVPMGDAACATVSLRSTWQCGPTLWGGPDSHHCVIRSLFDLNVSATRGDGAAVAYATSQAVPGERVEAVADESNQSQPKLLTYYDIPDGGSTVVYWNEVCISASTPTTGSPASAEPVCSQWPHAVAVMPDHLCFECQDPVAEHTTGIAGIGEAIARNTIVPPTGPDIHDRSTERVCGANTRIDIGCGAARLLHTVPACTGPTGSRTCSVEYWIDLSWALEGGCVLVRVDQFAGDIVGCTPVLPEVGTGSTRGPFEVTYSSIPAGGMDVDVWASVCLGNGNPQGWDGNGYTQCTIWSPATIHLPGA